MLLARRSSKRRTVGNYSQTWTFTTTVAPAAVPVLLLPLDNAVDQQIIGSVRWKPAGSADTYHLQVSTDSTFGGGMVVNDSTISDTVRSLTGLEYGTKYYWHVRSKNAVGSSAFSSVWNFRTVMSVPSGPSLALSSRWCHDSSHNRAHFHMAGEFPVRRISIPVGHRFDILFRNHQE